MPLGGVGRSAVRQLVSLHDAQFVLAREQGFASWPKLKAYAEPSSRSRHTRLFVADVAWIADRVHGFCERANRPARQRWNRFANGIRAFPIGRTRRFDKLHSPRRTPGWSTQGARLRDLGRPDKPGESPGIEPAHGSYRTVHGGLRRTAVWRCCRLRSSVARANPRLAGERGTNGNTLLNLAVSFAGKANWKGGVSTIEALLAAGSDVNDGNDRGWTPLHAAAYANRPEIASLLIEKGAALDAEAHGAGGTPLIAALFWGHREVADLLGRHSVAPEQSSRRGRAGHPELVDACFNPMAHSLPKPAPPEASTVRIAVSRTGSLRQIRRRFSTKHSCGPARAIALRAGAARQSGRAPRTPIPIEARR
jgi:hypothetical protein